MRVENTALVTEQIQASQPGQVAVKMAQSSFSPTSRDIQYSH